MKMFPLLVLLFLSCNATHLPSSEKDSSGSFGINGQIRTGADQTEKYLPYLKGKRVAVLANPTSVIGGTHLVDSLKTLGIKIVKVFGPEHGFRGNASNGAVVGDEVDPATGIPVISLYGKKSKATREDLADVDLVIYDLQDVGCRFYTNINALARMMESCAENGKELLILDRPDPNGYLIDGPVLDMKLKSGVGMFPLPISYGLTPGEFARMANGEGWLAGKEQCNIRIVPVAHYDHDMPYTLPVKPSPNLNTQQSIMLYPTLCLFEGTVISQGRGTYFPFTVLGNPELGGQYSFSFTPKSLPGMSETPLHMNQTCYGLDLRHYDIGNLLKTKQLHLQWMIEMYQAYPHKEKFFDYHQSKEMGSIDKLAGTTAFKQQIADGKTEKQIRDSWEPALGAYKKMRKKYLLYP
ncbi:MAG: exo-beta-N-acetylmuramidase NamZ family protein [Flavisolibacter sp.]